MVDCAIHFHIKRTVEGRLERGKENDFYKYSLWNRGGVST